jgi:hypothetical protein
LRKPLPKSASPFGAPSARKFTQAREPECCGIFGEGTALPGEGAESLVSFLSSGRISSPFAHTSCSHRRQSHVVGPAGDPQPRGCESANLTRAHRIPTHLKTPHEAPLVNEMNRNIIQSRKMSRTVGDSYSPRCRMFVRVLLSARFDF